MSHYFSRNKKYEIFTKSCIFSNPVLLRGIVLCMISDQGKYCFVKKKKKKGNILILFIYSVVATDFQHKCKLKYSLLLSFFLTRCTDNSFELGANTDVTKNNPTWCLSWAPVFYNISLPQPYLYSSLLQILLHNNLVSWRAHGPLKWLNFVSLG